ncbi:MAG: 30S ribosomal protein S21 [Patescibacteria group bacterium]
MIQVTKKDKAESTESLIRRFTRKVQQSGMLITAKENQYFEKPISKRDRRIKAISRRARRAEKVKRLKLGLK